MADVRRCAEGEIVAEVDGGPWTGAHTIPIPLKMSVPRGADRDARPTAPATNLAPPSRRCCRSCPKTTQFVPVVSALQPVTAETTANRPADCAASPRYGPDPPAGRIRRWCGWAVGDHLLEAGQWRPRAGSLKTAIVTMASDRPKTALDQRPQPPLLAHPAGRAGCRSCRRLSRGRFAGSSGRREPCHVRAGLPVAVSV